VTEPRPALPADVADATLLVDVARGDPAALEELYRRHAAAVLAAANRLTGDAGAAERVAEAVFVALWDDPATAGACWSVAAFLGEETRRRALRQPD
jgi:RNA polymerase sigma-70 factor, ECF subfamily